MQPNDSESPFAFSVSKSVVCETVTRSANFTIETRLENCIHSDMRHRDERVQRNRWRSKVNKLTNLIRFCSLLVSGRFFVFNFILWPIFWHCRLRSGQYQYVSTLTPPTRCLRPRIRLVTPTFNLVAGNCCCDKIRLKHLADVTLLPDHHRIFIYNVISMGLGERIVGLPVATSKQMNNNDG